MLKFLVLSIAVLYNSTHAHSPAKSHCHELLKNKNAEWIHCKKKEDCTVITGFCSHPASVNRKFSSEASAHLKSLEGDCRHIVKPEWSSKSVCDDGFCDVDFEKKDEDKKPSDRSGQKTSG